MRRITKLFNTKASSIDEANKNVIFTISDNKVDRMGEVVDQKTWDFKSYMKNPIVLWGHNPDEPENVLGTASTLAISDSGSHTDAELHFDTDINPKAALVFEQIKAGTLKTVSVGFINHDEEVKDGVPILKNNELLEISVVPIPANPRAIALSLREGTLSQKDAKWLMDGMRAEADLIEMQLMEEETKEVPVDTHKQIEVLTEAVTRMAEQINELSERLQAKDLSVEIKSLPLASEDRPWDADAAIKHVKEWASTDDGINFNKYGRAFFWGSGDKQRNYKLPFADVIGEELKAVWHGVAAAYEAVQGARGGVENIDKDAVLAKIKRYYQAFGKPWPEDDGKALPLESMKTKELNEDETSTEDENTTEDDKTDVANAGSDDQAGATTDEFDPEAELTPELQAQIDSALEDEIAQAA